MIDGRPILVDHPEGSVLRIDDEAFKVSAKCIERLYLFSPQIDRNFVIVWCGGRTADLRVREARQWHARLTLQGDPLSQF